MRRGCWDEQDHGLDYPDCIPTIDFKVTGAGHERIEQSYRNGCVNRREIVGFDQRQPEQRIAAWLCKHACSFVLFDTNARATVIGFECEKDADASGSSLSPLKCRLAGRKRNVSELRRLQFA